MIINTTSLNQSIIQSKLRMAARHEESGNLQWRLLECLTKFRNGTKFREVLEKYRMKKYVIMRSHTYDEWSIYETNLNVLEIQEAVKENPFKPVYYLDAACIQKGIFSNQRSTDERDPIEHHQVKWESVTTCECPDCDFVIRNHRDPYIESRYIQKWYEDNFKQKQQVYIGWSHEAQALVISDEPIIPCMPTDMSSYNFMD